MVAWLLVGAILAVCVTAFAEDLSPGPHLCSALTSQHVNLTKTSQQPTVDALPSGADVPTCDLWPSGSFLSDLKEAFAPVDPPKRLSARSPPLWL